MESLELGYAPDVRLATHPRRLALTLVGMLVLGWIGFALASEVSSIAAFSEATEIPKAWKPLPLKDVDRPTDYELVDSGGQRVLRAVSNDSASGLAHALDVDPHEAPVFRFRWKVSSMLDRSDVTTKTGDDYPARIYITFAYDPKKMKPAMKLKYNVARAFYKDLPASALTYYWSRKQPVEDIHNSPYGQKFVKMIAVDSGPDHVGEWRTHERNILDDYKNAFGYDAPRITGVVLMTDTDTTHDKVTTWYGDLELTPTPPPAN